MFSDYLLSFSILLVSKVGVLGVAPHAPSLPLPNQHQVMPKINPIPSPRSIINSFPRSKNDDKDPSSIILNVYDKLTTSHQTGPDQYVSEMSFPSDDYLKKAFETNKQKTLRQTVRENIREIDGSCLKLLSKRTTGNVGRNCVNMETFVTDLQEYIANMRSNSLNTRNLFFESQALFHGQLVDTSGVTDNRAVSLIYHLNEMIANVKKYNIDPRFLDGAEVTKVIGTEGRSITHWNAEGHWKTLLEYRDGEHSFINEELNNVERFSQQRNNLLRFLKENFPLGPYGSPYGNDHYQKESDLMKALFDLYELELKQRKDLTGIFALEKEYSEIFDILKPTVVFRNTYRVDPTIQISVKFFKDGSTGAAFKILPASSEEASYTSEFDVQNLMKLLAKPALIKGGEKRDENGIVREIRLGKLSSSTKKYYFSAIQLNRHDENDVKYRVRTSKKVLISRSQYPYTFLEKNIFFNARWVLTDLPVMERTSPEVPINGHGNIDVISDNRISNIQPNDVLSHVQQRKSSPKATSRDGISESDTIIYDGLVSTHAFSPDDALHLINLKNIFASKLQSFDINPKILNRTVVTQVFGASGNSITYLSSKGKFVKIIKFDNGEFSLKDDAARILQRKNPEMVANLISFLNHYLPGNVNGKPYENLQNDLENLKAELKNDSNDWNDKLDLIPSLMLQNAFGEKPVFRVAGIFSGTGNVQFVSIVFPRSENPTPTLIPATEGSNVPSEAIDFRVEKNDRSIPSFNLDDRSPQSDVGGKSSSKNVENVKNTFMTDPDAKVDEERKNDGTLKRFQLALQDPSTRLYKVKKFVVNSAVLGGSILLYENIPWVVSKTHINNFDGFFDDLNHQFDNDDIDPSIFDEPRVATNIFDEPNHNAHESIFGRVLGDHGGITGNINAMSHLHTDIIHGAQQDAHDFFELCQSFTAYVEDQMGIHCDHHGRFLMPHNDFEIKDLIESGRMHISHLPEFRVSVSRSFMNVLTGILWNKFRSLPVRDQVAIGAACVFVLPMLPKAAVTLAVQQVSFRVGASALISLSNNENYQMCVSNLIPYIGVLLGDPTHLVSGMTVTFLSVETSKFMSKQIANGLYWIMRNLLPPNPEWKSRIQRPIKTIEDSNSDD